jgi:hypothetical protein
VRRRELQIEAAEQLLELFESADAEDRDDPPATLANPGDRNLRRGRPELVGDPVHLSSGLQVSLSKAMS